MLLFSDRFPFFFLFVFNEIRIHDNPSFTINSIALSLSRVRARSFSHSFFLWYPMQLRVTSWNPPGHRFFSVLLIRRGVNRRFWNYWVNLMVKCLWTTWVFERNEKARCLAIGLLSNLVLDRSIKIPFSDLITYYYEVVEGTTHGDGQSI